PCYQETSFNNSKEFIKKIEQEYGKHGFTVLGAPERYMAADSLMFNTKYHLNKQGLESRTDSLIEDLKTVRIDSLGLLK
ncbi:MAG: hypothetical protein LBH04_01085, partial [Tannerellaceae bacterium]|nr:hypothetical protein [Tannerellaceae bacterium]